MADVFQLTPITPFYPTGAVTLQALNFAESTRRSETIFQALEAVTITRLWHYCTAATNPPVLRISLQGVDSATGFSDGTIKGATNNALNIFTPTAASGGWLTLGESYACTRGELLAIVVEYSSGTIDATHQANLNYASTNGAAGFPYVITTNTGTRSKVSNWPIYGYGSASKAYGVPIQAANSPTFNLTSSPDEYALRFIVPTDWCSTFKICGVLALFSPNPASTSFDINLYDSDGSTVLQQLTYDSDITASNITTARASEYWFPTSTLATLNAGTTYRIGVVPASSTNTLIANFATLSNDDMDALYMGKEWYQSSRTDAGAWTDIPTTRPYIVPIFADLTSGGGAAISQSPNRLLYVPPSSLILE